MMTDLKRESDWLVGISTGGVFPEGLQLIGGESHDIINPQAFMMSYILPKMLLG